MLHGMAQESAAEEFMARLRWRAGPVCPRCESRGAASRSGGAGGWRCRGCNHDFSVISGTALHGSRLPLEAWVTATAIADPNPREVARVLGVSAPTARRVADVCSSVRAAPGEPRLAALLRTRHHARGKPVSVAAGARAMPAGQRRVFSFLRRRIAGAALAEIAEGSGLSQRHTRRCLQALEAARIARCEPSRILWGYGTVVERLWSLDMTPQCVALMAVLPAPRSDPPDQAPARVPPQFWSCFQSGTHPAELRLPTDSLTVAAQMLDSADLAARSWALSHTPVEALAELRSGRGYNDAVKTSLDTAIADRRRG